MPSSRHAGATPLFAAAAAAAAADATAAATAVVRAAARRCARRNKLKVAARRLWWCATHLAPTRSTRQLPVSTIAAAPGGWLPYGLRMPEVSASSRPTLRPVLSQGLSCVAATSRQLALTGSKGCQG